MIQRDKEIIYKIADHFGMLPDDDGKGINTWDASWSGKTLFCKMPLRNEAGEIEGYVVDKRVPNFISDLNETHKLEQKLKDDNLWSSYCVELESVCSIGQNWEGWTAYDYAQNAIGATAKQRAEAFVRTIKK